MYAVSIAEIQWKDVSVYLLQIVLCNRDVICLVSMDRLKGSVGGGRGGRGGRGRKKGGKKGMRDTQAIWIGQGVM